MRVLFSSLPATGHFNSMTPIAEAMAAAGHEVAVCCADSLAEQVVGRGFTHFPGGAPTFGELFAGAPADPAERPWFAQRVAFARNAVEKMLPDLRAHAEAWQPDLLVRESAEFAAPLVAEMLGLPHADIGTGAWSSRDDRREITQDVLADWRDKLGLPPDPGNEMIFRYLHFAFAPPSWHGEAAHPRTAHFIRYEISERPGEVRPAWLDEPRTEPLVLASLGTVMHAEPGLFEAIIEALTDQPMSVVAAIGRDQDPARFGMPRANVRIEQFVPQTLVLRECDLFVTHGGFNSTKEGLSLGLPLLVIPISGDQPYSAERVEALALGRRVTREERAPATIRDRAREVLDDPRYRANARRFAAEMRAQPPLSHAVGLLERLARDCEPIPLEPAGS